MTSNPNLLPNSPLKMTSFLGDIIEKKYLWQLAGLSPTRVAIGPLESDYLKPNRPIFSPILTQLTKSTRPKPLKCNGFEQFTLGGPFLLTPSYN